MRALETQGVHAWRRYIVGGSLENVMQCACGMPKDDACRIVPSKRDMNGRKRRKGHSALCQTGCNQFTDGVRFVLDANDTVYESSLLGYVSRCSGEREAVHFTLMRPICPKNSAMVSSVTSSGRPET